MSKPDCNASVTVLVCTRNRGPQIVPTIATILDNRYPTFELVVVDQSENDSTAQALTPYLTDPRVRYLSSETRGLGNARNVGIESTKGEIILFTDDDCEVPADWIETMAQVFSDQPEAMMAFCEVRPGVFDPAEGYIPIFLSEADYIIDSRSSTRMGIGAGMAVRRSACASASGFDPYLGAGGVFPSAEEADMANRMLLRGYKIAVTRQTHVVHNGFRSWNLLRQHTMRDVTGSGAALAKLIRFGDRRLAAKFVRIACDWALEGAKELVHLKRPSAWRRISWWFYGFKHGWSASINRETLCFALSASEADRLRTKFISKDV